MRVVAVDLQLSINVHILRRLVPIAWSHVLDSVQNFIIATRFLQVELVTREARYVHTHIIILTN